MYGFKALIFDVDGTLADTERDGHRVAFNAAFREAGLDWDWSVSLYGELLAVTGGKERIRYYLERWLPAFSPPESLETFIPKLHRSKTTHYLDLLRKGSLPLRPGVMRLLTQARQAGIRLAIATTTTPENVIALLEASGPPGLRDWFAVIAAGDVVPRKKPAPDIYQLALDQLGLPPRDCIAIEDSDNGARSAWEAGLHALLVTTSTYTQGQDFGAAPLVLDSLGEPDRPARVIAGTLAPHPYVDLEALDRLHRQVYGIG